jgi:hypothetical protein
VEPRTTFIFHVAFNWLCTGERVHEDDSSFEFIVGPLRQHTARIERESKLFQEDVMERLNEDHVKMIMDVFRIPILVNDKKCR